MTANSKRHAARWCVPLLAAIVTVHAAANEAYHFIRPFPARWQMQAFSAPSGIAVDSAGNVYVTDRLQDAVYKFNAFGALVDRWGTPGSGPGQFHGPRGIAVDWSGNIYVADTGNHRIQKFDVHGQFVAQWGGFGSGNGKFNSPFDVTVESTNAVYVADTGNHRIQKFTAGGQFVLKWGSLGSGVSQFIHPTAVTTGGIGSVYVADAANNRIQRFSSVGSFVSQWSIYGSGPGQVSGPFDLVVSDNGKLHVADQGNGRILQFIATGIFEVQWGNYGREQGEFNAPEAVAVDISGNIYVADTGNARIQKLTQAGNVIAEWGAQGMRTGQLFMPQGLAVDPAGNLYVADSGNDRVQIFDPAGNFDRLIGAPGIETGEFYYPQSVAVDAFQNVYVADTGNSRIQKFNDAGEFLAAWGEFGAETGEFDGLQFVATDTTGDHVFVLENFANRIQRFSPAGVFETQWGGLGSQAGRFFDPRSIAIGATGDVFVADFGNDRIQKFSANGVYLDQFGSSGAGAGQLQGPVSLAVDATGVLHVADHFNHRIQQFDASGNLIAVWDSPGFGFGEFVAPDGIAVDPAGNVFVLESHRHRVQMFSPGAPETAKRAVIVASGGPYAGNTLWDATRLCANMACRALLHQGYSRDEIHYLGALDHIDLDGNGDPDDVDSVLTRASLLQTIATAAAAADNLVFYLVGPMGDGKLRLNDVETIPIQDLQTALDAAGNTVPGDFIVIADTSRSGAIVSSAGGPGQIAIASAAPDESAHFLNTGGFSFSYLFWCRVFGGDSVLDAFQYAAGMLEQAGLPQTPQLDDSANGALAAATYLGNAQSYALEFPVLNSVSPPQVLTESSSANIVAVPGPQAQGSARTVAVIQPPAWTTPYPDTTVLSLPTIELIPQLDAPEEWIGTYNGFSLAGIFHAFVYSTSMDGMLSMPGTTSITVNNPVPRKAVIVAGGPESSLYVEGATRGARAAYAALRNQGYSDENIRYFSPVSDTGVDASSTFENIQADMLTWARTNVRDLTFALIGSVNDDGFGLAGPQALRSIILDQWLDAVQTATTGKVIVVADVSRGLGFCDDLRPPPGRQRILLSSTSSNESALFADAGRYSYSTLFWSKIGNGATVRQAHAFAKENTRFWVNGPIAHLDDTGNGIFNEAYDGLISHATRLGVGVVLAADLPLVSGVSPQVDLAGEFSAAFWADPVTSAIGIDRVSAVIVPPRFRASDPGMAAITALPAIELTPSSATRFEGEYAAFERQGDYQIALLAVDTRRNVSTPGLTSVFQAVGFEPHDINGDGLIDAVDIQLVINAALGIPIAFDADVNGDGSVDAIDVQLVTNAALDA